MTLLIVQSADVCPKRWYLKHLGMLLEIGLGLICEGKFIRRVWIFYGMEGVGGEWFELPLLIWTSMHKDFEPFFSGSGGTCLSM